MIKEVDENARVKFKEFVNDGGILTYK